MMMRPTEYSGPQLRGGSGLYGGNGEGLCGSCDLFWRQFFALVRKNFLTKRRAPVQLFFELALPAFFMWILSIPKSDETVEYYPANIPVNDSPVPSYEALQAHAIYPHVLCDDDNLFMRCKCYNEDADDDYDDDSSSSWYWHDYLSGAAIDATGSAMWATGHGYTQMSSICSAANVTAENSSLPSTDQCTAAKFVAGICSTVVESGFDIDSLCGSGTSALDLSAADYVEIITGTLALLASTDSLDLFTSTSAGGSVLKTEDDIDTFCQSLVLAVMPADSSNGLDQASDFFDFVTTTYPNTSNHWRMLSTEQEFEDLILDANYSRAIGEAYVLPAISAGIVFSSGSPDWEYTIRANYSKQSGSLNVPGTDSTVADCMEPTGCSPPWTALYHQSAALALQQLVDNWIINQTVSDGSATASISAPVIRLSEFPNPAYEIRDFWDQISIMFAILVTIAVMYPVANVIHAIVKEKELRIKESLKMMGLTGAAHTASWTFHFLSLFLCTSVILTILSRGIFEHSDTILVFLYFFLFFMASTAFCFFVSAFFSRAKTAAAIGALVYFVALFPFFALDGEGVSANERRAGCLLPTTCLALGTTVFSELEDVGLGVTSETKGMSEDGFTFNDVLGMFFLDTLLYAALAWYAGHVLPSEWGTAQRPWFVFTKAFWCPGLANRAAMSASKDALGRDESDNRDSIEPVSGELKAQVQKGECVAVRGLTKVYKTSTGGTKVAVDNLDLTMYRGQITALLGHNGAGKTTTIAMLTGMTPVTSGQAFVAGRDATLDMVNVRRSLGVCPQHDILYPDLTVREHLRMFAVLKGVPRPQLRDVIRKSLMDVGLTEKESELTKTLSGGQKRKLSVGIALIGGSRVVFLDEPTSGMDPHSRRFTWDLISKNREGRVIVLTTHFMDEADLLGDRVAIMADGALKCCGSSLFLKNHYGVGYNLTIVRAIGGPEAAAAAVSSITDGKDAAACAGGRGYGNSRRNDDAGGLQEGAGGGGDEGVRPIKRLVRSHVRSAALLGDVGAELSFQLPNDASSSFKAMLSEIDARKVELGINSYGLSVTTLDEVFLRVAEGSAENAGRLLAGGGGGDDDGTLATATNRMHRDASLSSSSAMTTTGATNDKNSNKALSSGETGVGNGNGNAPKAGTSAVLGNTKKSNSDNNNGNGNGNVKGQDLSKPSLFCVHMVALMKKRWLTFRRDKKMWAFIVFMPAFFVFVGVMIVRLPTGSDQPALVLTPEHYNSGRGAPFPYAEQCTNTAVGGACDPGELMAWLTDPDSARPKSLDIDATSDPADGVELLNTVLLEDVKTNTYDQRVYGAVSFREADSAAGIFDYTIHSNYSALHAVPTYLNEMSTAILRLVSGDGDVSITTIMHPMPRTEEEKVWEEFTDVFEGFLISLFVMIAFCFLPAGWIAFIVREKENKCKHQQVVSGVGLNAYWVSSLLWDFLSALIPAGFTIAVLVLKDVSALLDNGAALVLVCLFMLYALSMPTFTYLWSFLFRSHSMAQNVFLIVNFVLGLLAPLVVWNMSFFPKLETATRIVGGILRFCPQFALGEGLLFLGLSPISDELEEEAWEPFDMESTGRDIVYMACCSVGYLVILLILERKLAGSSALSGLCGQVSLATRTHRLSPLALGDEDQIDEDVAREAQRVARGDADSDAVKVDKLSKIYPTSRGVKVAVKTTSLGIPTGECFGLLGVNGAGKSTILSILSGEIPPTDGASFLGGYNVRKEPEAIHALVGYCPQFDALFETLTGREHLKLYGAIKGIPSDKLNLAVEEKIDEMGLSQYADRLTRGYSGGNKRKLSVAIAMIGDPQIVFLDEPSTGMDPMARRMMWNYVRRTVTENKECAMILTTHSMDECEALCQRIGIMVGGRLRCLGSSQHLKTRFGKGFMLEARVRAIPVEEVERMLATIAPATNNQANLPVTVLGPALDAAGEPHLAPEIVAHGRGASIYHALQQHGAVLAREFAAWLCLEKKSSRVMQFVGNTFHGAVMREKQSAKMRFELPQQENMTLADMFGIIEENGAELCIGEYALSQTSLEQIFNGFAAQQEEEQGRAAGIV